LKWLAIPAAIWKSVPAPSSSEPNTSCIKPNALTDLAEVLRFLERADEAAKAAEQARRLYEQKGNVAAAQKLRAFIGES